MMRTPVVLVTGRGDPDGVAVVLMHEPGTVVVEHDYDGQIVRRRVSNLQNGVATVAELALELVGGCVSCTIRNDLLIVLRRLHRRGDARRIVIRLARWLEPEPICQAIHRVPVSMGPGYLDGPAGRDVQIAAVVTTIDSTAWLGEALGADELADGRTVAQVAVGQAEFADVLVLTGPDSATLDVLRRLTPTARITVSADRVEQCLAHLESDARRGRERSPHDPLLAGQPPLNAAGPVSIVEFNATTPFHPQRLHSAIDILLDGVIRTRGRMFLAQRPDDVMTIESAGGSLLVEHSGTWLAAMAPSELAYADPQRRALAGISWDPRFGDRHTAMVVLVCGAQPTDVTAALHAALLTDDEVAHPDQWADYPDPFGDEHADPCDDPSLDPEDVTASSSHEPGDIR
jgi:G3E family GTPase